MLLLKQKQPVTGDIAYIKLTRGMYATVDSDLKPYLDKFVWRAVKSEYKWYAVTRKTIGKRTITTKMHRLIANTPPDQVCHHRNHNSLDNRRENLQNMYSLEHKLYHAIDRHTKKVR